jgi:CRISPR system Cascade subunit CasC
VWKGLDLTIEAALQVAHAISTHEARPEVDYFVAKDDVTGDDAGGAHIGEALFASACFYKYFSIHWDTLVKNLEGFQGNKEHLAAHTIGAFIRGAAMVNPGGKQNSFAAHNPPDGILIEIKDAPISYANAFAKPAAQGERDIISQSISQLGQYVHDLDTGYGKPKKRFWFSPNLRYPLSIVDKEHENTLAENNFRSLEELIPAVVAATGHDWQVVQGAVISPESAS